jgi:hypothetical protein
MHVEPRVAKSVLAEALVGPPVIRLGRGHEHKAAEMRGCGEELCENRAHAGGVRIWDGLEVDCEVRQGGKSRERGGGVGREALREAEPCERHRPRGEIRWCGWERKLGDTEALER